MDQWECAIKPQTLCAQTATKTMWGQLAWATQRPDINILIIRKPKIHQWRRWWYFERHPLALFFEIWVSLDQMLFSQSALCMKVIDTKRQPHFTAQKHLTLSHSFDTKYRMMSQCLLLWITRSAESFKKHQADRWPRRDTKPHSASGSEAKIELLWGKQMSYVFM